MIRGRRHLAAVKVRWHSDSPIARTSGDHP
jgi:hypothetical protein